MYTNNIQMMMDFMSLSFSIDNSAVSRKDKQLAVKLQGDLLKLVPTETAQQKQMYNVMKNIYDINVKQQK